MREGLSTPEGELNHSKKRPKVLQAGGDGGGNAGPVNPNALGSDNPRKTPTGDGPDITGDGGGLHPITETR